MIDPAKILNHQNILMSAPTGSGKIQTAIAPSAAVSTMIDEYFQTLLPWLEQDVGMWGIRELADL
jgi:replicative superfamily II helicase